MQAYSVRVYGGACIVCCLCTVVRNVYGMFNTGSTSTRSRLESQKQCAVKNRTVQYMVTRLGVPDFSIPGTSTSTSTRSMRSTM